MTEGRDLPWLQDTTGGIVTVIWEAAYRDFVFLDPANERPIAAYNLTTNSLFDPANRAELKDLLRGLAAFKDIDGDKLSDFWEEGMYGDSGSAGPTDDGDRDLANHLLEYALGSRADSAASLPPTLPFIVEIDGERFPAIAFRRRLGASGGLTYVVEFSEDGAAWSSAPEGVVEFDRINPYDGTGTEIVTFRSTQPIPEQGQAIGVLRVRTILP